MFCLAPRATFPQPTANPSLLTAPKQSSSMTRLPPTANEICLTQQHAGGEATLRLAFAALALVAAVWLLAVDGRTVPRIAASLSLVFGLAWAWRFVRSRTQNAQTDQLRMNENALVLRKGGSEQTVPWLSIDRIELDQDALVVCVMLREGGEVRVEPGYGGLGLDDLGKLIHGRLEASRVCTTAEHD